MKLVSKGDILWEGQAEDGMAIVGQLKSKEKILGLLLGDELIDLHTPLKEKVKDDNAQLEIVGPNHERAIELFRHTSAHVLAEAVQELHPGTQVTIGPVIDKGFYYDFAREEAFKLEDLPEIEKKMKKIIGRGAKMRRESWPVEKAIEHFKGKGELYKVELIEDLVKNEGIDSVTIYFQGDWMDLCRGPHLPKLSDIPAVKLLSVAGAYWRGDEKNAMLTRIYGTAFPSKEEMKKHLFQIEEAKKRDHRKLGTEMELFSFHEEAPASPFFHAAGAQLFNAVKRVLSELNDANGFEPVHSPLILSKKLWEASGHYDNYRENMYFTEVDEQDFAVKPMNCPGHCLIYGNTRHSYRDLPIRLAEFGRCHRHERSGVVAGLFRVRSFVQDDAHVFCTEDQVEEEILSVLRMVSKFYSLFDFKYSVELSTRPQKRIGSEETWDKAEAKLKSALEAAGENYKLNPGDGAFYGPKIDFHLEDSLGRTHQCGTVQLDFSMPERFSLSYNGADNQAHQPVMIHRAIAGSLERFLGILIEHFGGNFPFWLAPRQLAILSVVPEASGYAQKIFDECKGRGYRPLLDVSDEKIGPKIKKYRKYRIPYMMILGENEASSGRVSLRLADGSQKNDLSMEEFWKLTSQGERPSFLSPTTAS